MKTNFSASGADTDAEQTGGPDAERLENMRELLADLRMSIQTQRHLIDVSRSLLDRS